MRMEKNFRTASGDDLPGTPTIAVYMHTLYNGGVERVMMNLMQGFCRSRDFRRSRGGLPCLFPFEKLVPAGVSVVRLNAHKSAQRLPRFITYLRRRRPRAILSATHLANEIACIAKRVSGSSAQLILTEHSNLSADLDTSSSSARRVLVPLATRFLYPWADAIVSGFQRSGW